MNAAEMPTTQDTAIVEALGRPLAVLYAQAAAGTVEPMAQRVLELRSWLAMVEDQTLQTRLRIHHATAGAADLYGLSTDDLRFDVAFLDATLRAGRRCAQALGELLQTVPAGPPLTQRQVEFTQAKIAAISAPGGGLTVRPGPVGESALEAGAGRHRR